MTADVYLLVATISGLTLFMVSDDASLAFGFGLHEEFMSSKHKTKFYFYAWHALLLIKTLFPVLF